LTRSPREDANNLYLQNKQTNKQTNRNKCVQGCISLNYLTRCSTKRRWTQ